ncbi:MAG: hypothetical protein MUE34_08175 [Acidimicrobiales bacterium]|jgi:hypothetical protein|nr:hypothetical protein [Acidimicrobiales bacterium]
MPVEVQVRDDEIDITLTGWDAVWAFKRRLRIPMGLVRSARVLPRADALRLVRWRTGGTGFPGVCLAGRFSVRDRKGERAFLSVYRDTELLVVETSVARPRYVILQHPDRHDLAWWIGERVQPAR